MKTVLIKKSLGNTVYHIKIQSFFSSFSLFSQVLHNRRHLQIFLAYVLIFNIDTYFDKLQQIFDDFVAGITFSENKNLST